VEQILNIYGRLTALYSPVELGIMLLSVIFFLMQSHYYVFRYGRLPHYRNRRVTDHITPGGVSVVVALREDYEYVEQSIPLIMNQNYETFELVAVYVGRDHDFRDALYAAQKRYPKLTVTGVNEDRRFEISDKMACNVGVKAARYDNIILATPDVLPSSVKWLRLMARGFVGNSVVISYCGIEPGTGFANRLMRASRLMTSVRYLSAAIRGRAYRGIRGNFGITKGLYFGSKGFNYLNMNIGEDDLYVQEIVTKNNVSVVISPGCTTRERFWGDLGYWRTIRAYYDNTLPFYPLRARQYIFGELFSRTLFFASVVALVFVAPAEVKLGAVMLFALRLMTVSHVMSRICRRLGEHGLMWTLVFYDLVAPFTIFSIYIKRKTKRDRRVWR
jgi:hypothetical protein